MVAVYPTVWSHVGPWLLAQAEQPLVVRLDPQQRVKLLIAAASLVFLALLLFAIVVWMSRWTRRYVHRAAVTANRPLRPRGLSDDDWAIKPLDGGETGDDEDS